MQNNPELCERCNVVHMQEPDAFAKDAAAAMETIVEAENAEWRKMVDERLGAVLSEGERDRMLLHEMGISESFLLDQSEEPTLAGAAINQLRMKPHQQLTLDRIRNYMSNASTQATVRSLLETLKHNPVVVGCDFFDAGQSHKRMTAQMPRDNSSGIFAGLCEGIFPHTHQGFTRGVFRSKNPQLSQIPKSPEARKLMRDRNETFGLRYGQQTSQEGEFIPKRDPNERIMFMVDSYPSDMMRELEHTFENDPHVTLMLDAGHRCGKTRMTGEMFDEFGRGVRGFAGPPGPAGPTEMHGHVRTPTLKALDDYHYRSARDIYEGTPGRPKSSKAKRKAQKAARKGNRK